MRYLVLFGLVLAAVSFVFLVALAVVLQPAFDIAPEVSNEEAARFAYARTIERIALSLGLADLIVLAVIGVIGYYLADRTLRPIREAHDRQRRFVADASHEMRGPLTAIQSTAEAALRRDAPPSSDREALRSILVASSRLGRLTTDLLVLARTESGLLARDSEPVDLSIVAAEVSGSAGSVHGGGRPVEVTLVPDLIVRADADDLGRIIANLLENARRHGGDPISLRTGSTDGIAYVEVVDHGRGIAEADMGRIFDPFYRVRADASSPSGSGLGLAIARELAGRHGGRLRVASRPGAGATFRLELPIARAG